MAYLPKPKFIEEKEFGKGCRIMIITAWTSFLISTWLYLFIGGGLGWFALFWFVLTVLLVALMGEKSKSA